MSNYSLFDDLNRLLKIQSEFPRSIAESLERASKIQSEFPRSIAESLYRVANLQSEFPRSLFENLDLTLKLESAVPTSVLNDNTSSFSISDINSDGIKAFNFILQSDLDSPSSSESKIDIIINEINEINKNNNSISRKDFLIILISFLINIMFNLIDFDKIRKNLYGISTPKNTVRQTKKSISSLQLSTEQTNKYRIASRPDLKYHKRPHNKSAVIGYLTLGQVVYLLNKRGEWGNIAIDCNLSGWTLSKYLKKL